MVIRSCWPPRRARSIQRSSKASSITISSATSCRSQASSACLTVQSRSELDRIVFESIGFFCPGFTDGFERREPIQSLETLGEVVGVEECLDVLAKLVVAVVVVAPNSRLFESTVHPLDLPVRPRMIWLCQPMLNPVRPAEQIEHMGLPPRSRT